MSTSKGELAAVQGLIATDVSIDLDAVVSVYVSQYEDSLFIKKKDLSKQIKGIKDDLKILEKTLIQSIDKSKYDISVPVLDLISKVSSVELNWGDEDEDYADSKIVIKIDVAEKEKTERYGRNELTTKRKVAVPAKSIRDKASWEKELSGLNGELLETMSLIKGVSRKERQVKGKISGMKLDAGGFGELLNSPELLKLVELD